MLGDGVEQRHCLQSIPTGPRTHLFHHSAAIDGILNRRHDQLQAQPLDRAIAELQHLVEVLAGVDVHDWKRDLGRREGLDCKVQHHQRVLTTGEQQHGSLELGGDLAYDIHGFGFELGEVVDLRHRPADLASIMAMTRLASVAVSTPCVRRWSSASCGASYGADTPVNSCNSPASARWYRPFGSRAMQTSNGGSTNTSMKRNPSSSCRRRARQRS